MEIFSKEIKDAAKLALEKAGLISKIKEAIKLSKEVKLAEATTEDGKVLSFEGDVLAVSTPVIVKDAAGVEVPLSPEPMTVTVMNADGTKSKAIILNGVVTELTPVVEELKKEEVPAPAAMDPAQMAVAMSAQKKEIEDSFELKLSTVTNELTASKKALVELSKTHAVLLEFAEAIVSTPIEDPADKAMVKPFEEMTPIEKHRFAKYGKI